MTGAGSVASDAQAEGGTAEPASRWTLKAEFCGWVAALISVATVLGVLWLFVTAPCPLTCKLQIKAALDSVALESRNAVVVSVLANDEGCGPLRVVGVAGARHGTTSFDDQTVTYTPKNVCADDDLEYVVIDANKDVGRGRINIHTAAFTGSRTSVNTLTGLSFKFDGAELGDDAKCELEIVANRLAKTRPSSIASVALAGHTCCLGDESHNIELSFKRARAAHSYLQSLLGVMPVDTFGPAWTSKLARPIGFGSKHPIASGAACGDCKVDLAETRSCLAPQRRVELQVRR